MQQFWFSVSVVNIPVIFENHTAADIPWHCHSTITYLYVLSALTWCRKRHLFASQELADLLLKEGLDCNTYATAQKQSVFSLEDFDNHDYDSRIPAEWVPKAQGGVSSCIVVAASLL